MGGFRFLKALAVVAVLAGAQATWAQAQTVSVETLGLQPGSDITELNVNWYSANGNANAGSYVRIYDASGEEEIRTVEGTYGSAPTTTQNKFWHKVNITNLVPGTKYKYAVSNDGTDWSDQYDYAAPEENSTFTFAAISDVQVDANQSVADRWNTVAGKLKNAGVNLIVHTGDQVDAMSTLNINTEYTRFFAPDVLRSVPFGPVMGNHDSHCEFLYRYNLPNEQNRPTSCTSIGSMLTTTGSTDVMFNAGNYYYRYNNVLFIGLNTANYPSNTTASGFITKFDNTIRAAKAANEGKYDFIVVYHHKSTQSVASHAADVDIEFYVRAGFERIMTEHGVSLVLAGHDHISVRSKFLVWKQDEGATGKSVPHEEKPHGYGNFSGDNTGTIYLTLSTASGMKDYKPFEPGQTSTSTTFPYLVDGRAGRNNLSASNPLLGMDDYKYTQSPEYTIVSVDGETMTLKTYSNADNANPIDEFTITTDNVVGGPHREGVPRAKKPAITAQPESGTVTVDDEAGYTLSVTASVKDDGALSYQWYSNTSASKTGGTAIEGATGTTYAVPIADFGIYYYYVVVTNSITVDDEVKTASVTSDVVTVKVNPPGPPPITVSWNPPALGSYGYVKGETVTAVVKVGDDVVGGEGVTVLYNGSPTPPKLPENGFTEGEVTVTVTYGERETETFPLSAIEDVNCSSCEYYFGKITGSSRPVREDLKEVCQTLLKTSGVHIDKATNNADVLKNTDRYYHFTALDSIKSAYNQTAYRIFINGTGFAGGNGTRQDLAYIKKTFTEVPEGGWYMYVDSSSQKHTFSVSGGKNYCLPPDLSIPAPVATSGLIYDGELKTGVSEGIGYTLSGHTDTKAGSYTATATLARGYVWDDGSDDGSYEPVKIDWSIAKAKGVFVEAEVSVTYALGLTLAGVQLPDDYVWNESKTPLGVGDGQKFEAYYTDPSGNYTEAVGDVTVNVAKAPGVFKETDAVSAVYSPTLTLGDIELPAIYVWEAPETSLNAGDNQKFAAIYTDLSGNYTEAVGDVTVNVAKAAGVFVETDAVSAVYSPTLILGNILLPTNYVWEASETSLNAGDNQSFKAIYTDQSGNYTGAVGNITVNVEKAAPTVEWPFTTPVTYGARLNRSKLTDYYAEVRGSFYWTNGSVIPNVTNDGYEVTFAPTDSKNYKTLTGLVTVTVNKAKGRFKAAEAVGAVYSPTLTLGDIELPTIYVWEAPETSLNAGDKQSFKAIYTDPSGNYTEAVGNVTVNVAKAAGVFLAADAVSATYTSTLKLGDITLPTYYVWNTPETSLNAGDGQSFAAIYTDPSGNYTDAVGDVTVNVAKADGIFGTPDAVSVTYTSALKLGDITLPTNYVWNTPETSLNAGDGQSFAAIYTDPSGNYTEAVGNITVNVAKAAGVFLAADAVGATYTSTLKLGDITLPTDYVWNTLETSLNAGDNQSFEAIYTDPSGNYTDAVGNVTVNVAKADGIFLAADAVSAAYTSTLKLGDIPLSTEYVWNTPETPLSAGNNQSFAAIYTDPSGNYTDAVGNVTVNVAKANPAVTWPAGFTATEGQTLSEISIGGGTGAGTFSWTAPETDVGEAGENTHGITFTPTDAANYNVLTQAVTVNVEKAQQEVVVPPEVTPPEETTPETPPEETPPTVVVTPPEETPLEETTPETPPSTSVRSSERVVPAAPSIEEATVIAPVTALSGEFTAGPNPVAKSSGAVNFFRQGKRVNSGELRVYDATGNVVSKIRISDKALNSQAKRIVGSWDLRDAKGRQVFEGTYLVKGVLKTSDGNSEKVSLILGVR